jgi:alkylation response protein AidB-like acyl-CoA dehydrogenase
MDFRLSEEQMLLRRTVREFAEAEIRPHVMEWDEAQQFPMDLLPKLASLGLTGIQIDERYGGAGMTAVDYCICIEELARVDPSIALSVAAHNGLCSAHINMFGSDVQKDQWLGPLARGEMLGAWGRAWRRQRRRRHADDGREAGAVLVSQRIQELLHPWTDRRRDGRDGADRPHQGASRRLRVRRP